MAANAENPPMDNKMVENPMLAKKQQASQETIIGAPKKLAGGVSAKFSDVDINIARRYHVSYNNKLSYSIFFFAIINVIDRMYVWL